MKILFFFSEVTGNLNLSSEWIVLQPHGVGEKCPHSDVLVLDEALVWNMSKSVSQSRSGMKTYDEKNVTGLIKNY